LIELEVQTREGVAQSAGRSIQDALRRGDFQHYPFESGQFSGFAASLRQMGQPLGGIDRVAILALLAARHALFEEREILCQLNGASIRAVD